MEDERHHPYEELGEGLDPRPAALFRHYAPVYTELPAERPMTGAYGPIGAIPLAIARWRWSGRPQVFDCLDANGDGAVDQDELEALGRGLDLLRDDTAGPLDAVSAARWGGAPDLFQVLDADQDGRVTRRELEVGLGPHALRLVHGEPAHGPVLPPGATHGWLGLARWVSFPDREAKARYMARAAEHDAKDPAVIGWARQFMGLPREKRAAAILTYCQRCIRYERDPAWWDLNGNRHGIELLDSSSVGFARGYGDCDLKARMFTALCLACTLRAKTDPVFVGEEGFPHVRAKVLVEDSESAGGGTWEVADPTLVYSRIGYLPRRKLTAFLPEDEGASETGDPGPPNPAVHGFDAGATPT